MVDVMQGLVTLFTNNWNAANTDSVTPTFLKITDPASKTYDFNTKKDLVLIHVPRTTPASNGFGVARKQIEWVIDIDIRTLGSDQETHFRKVYDEVIRILDANILNPFTGIAILETDDLLQQELSDKMKGLFREVVPVKAIDYNVAR